MKWWVQMVKKLIEMGREKGSEFLFKNPQITEEVKIGMEESYQEIQKKKIGKSFQQILALNRGEIKELNDIIRRFCEFHYVFNRDKKFLYKQLADELHLKQQREIYLKQKKQITNKENNIER